MTSEEKHAADLNDKLKEADSKRRADAEQASKEGEKLDKLLTCIDALCSRMDSFEESEKKRADAAKSDSKKSGDEPDDPKEVLADSAIPSTNRAARLREDYEANLAAQARADTVCSAHGTSAPRSMEGEDPIAYRVRLLRQHQQFCAEGAFKTVDLRAVAKATPSAFDGIERQIYADSMEAARRPNGENDTLMSRTTTDPVTGQRMVNFYGKRSFIWHLKPDQQRVTAIKDRRVA